jgi:predicted transcriptional regulator
MRNAHNTIPTDRDIFDLLQELTVKVKETQRQLSLAEQTRELIEVEHSGNQIRTARKAQKMTLEELADLAGISKATLGKIERGIKEVQLASLLKISETLGLKVWVG